MSLVFAPRHNAFLEEPKTCLVNLTANLRSPNPWDRWLSSGIRGARQCHDRLWACSKRLQKVFDPSRLAQNSLGWSTHLVRAAELLSTCRALSDVAGGWISYSRFSLALPGQQQSSSVSARTRPWLLSCVRRWDAHTSGPCGAIHGREWRPEWQDRRHPVPRRSRTNV